MTVAFPAALVGRHVDLLPLSLDHVDELVAAATVDRASYGFTEVPDTAEWMADYVSRLLAQRDADQSVPCVQRELATKRVVGCTRFLELRWWRGRAEPDEVEIGGTWLAADVQRTPINTESKMLLLNHAFESWEVVRVAICTDARNDRSRTAILRLGASFEGVLRHHRPSTVAGEAGRPRNTAVFSITDDEWPAVRRRLTDRLATSD